MHRFCARSSYDAILMINGFAAKRSFLRMHFHKQHMEEDERNSVMSALLVIILTMAAFVAYFTSGNSIVFWVVAILALIAGIYMAYRLSEEGKALDKKLVSRKGSKGAK